jgi:dipeptidyl aminopeptidase/acylaminoacyl peptidase
MKKMMWIRGFWIVSFGVLVAASVPPAKRLREPLPLDVALSIRGHNSRSPIGLAPDGEWVAHTTESDETVARATLRFSATGFPFAEGGSRMEVFLTNTKTGRVVRPGGTKSSSWAAVWSPDGRKAVFYSDEGGEAGLWIWDRATEKSERFPGVIVRPFFGFETAKWSPDGRQVLCKILPAGMTVAQANALSADESGTKRFPPVDPGRPSVFVLKSKGRAPGEKLGEPERRIEGNLEALRCDLAILDLETRAVTRILERGTPQWYAFSSDGKRVAAVEVKGYEANSQQPVYDLKVMDLAAGASRTLGEKLRLGYGIEISWSPAGDRLAIIGTGQLAKGEIQIIDLNGRVRALGGEGAPNFNEGEGEWPPLWDAAGKNVYAMAAGKLWRTDAETGKAVLAGDIPEHAIRGIVYRPGTSTVWSGDGGRSLWVTARKAKGSLASIFRIDQATGKPTAVLEESKSYLAVFNLDACDKTREIAYISRDQQHPADVWILDTASGRTRQVSRLNEGLDRYELGQARLIEWRGIDGAKLSGTLLLPPDFRAGRPVPLAVFVYGGAQGAVYLHRFGIWGDMPTFNMHVLATRGYAVLHPDAPVREGSPMRDLVESVITGVNAAVEQGFADPDRLAVMGQSYGSYSTLALITQTKRFKAAIITAAVLHPDLLSDYLEMSPDGTDRSTGYYEHGQGNMGGTPWQFKDRYIDNSPIYLFDKIETPLLIGQGAKDGKLIPSDAMFVALRRLNKEVEYRIYENEEHVISQKPNVLDFWNRRLEFLDDHLDVSRDAKGLIVYEGDAVKPRK